MRKAIVLISALVALVLAGCTEGEIKKTTDRFFNDGNLDLTDKAHVAMPLTLEVKSEENKVIKEMLESLGIQEPEVKLEEIEEYNELKENMNELKSNSEYIVKDVKLNEDQTEAEAIIDVHYVSVGELLVRDMSEVMDRNVLKVFSGEKVSEKEFLTMLFETMNDTVEGLNVDEDSLSIKESTSVNLLKVEKEWKISSVSEDMLDALMLDFPKEKNASLNKKIEEVEANRLFLEIESNLRASFDEVSNLIKDGKVEYKYLLKNDKLITKTIQENLGINAEVVKVAGDDEGVYYITKGSNKNELTIVVINEEEKFTFTDRIK